jgi:hypothetical protein
MDPESLKKAFRNGWILVALATAFVIGFFAFTLAVGKDAPKPDWEMGGVPFVPASSDYGNNYYTRPPEVKGEDE